MASKEPLRITDPETLRAMAHPLRQRILVELNVREHARAADLARALGEPANSISFHLRVLARHHFIEEAPELARDKRDRVWRPVVEQFVIDRDIAGAERAIAPYTRWLRDMFLRDRDAPGEQENFHEGTASGAFLTRDEAERMTAEVTAVLEKWWDRTGAAKRADPDDPERTYYQVVFAVGPRDLATEPAQED
ncbi:winged helix-turn-helix domain-containing protein [Promicromonospora iranensis]|uniref:DNA-binding transcriptional ArsR family regulator n=1 Tax=Promicromonospora iranensis TaxID=1105144 RepID=A0ABU2CM54_9MICO|nr:helix-turn-helix domain-containing protein [Promicromonospora iranensis]MDR7382429.1 DNA-binding transcriptional ArsR family regulator [Promicromonospora iranensis]